MNLDLDQIEDNRQQLKGNAKQQSGKLTDDQLGVISDQQERLSDKVQEIYGVTKDEADKKLTGWQKIQQETADSSSTTAKPE